MIRHVWMWMIPVLFLTPIATAQVPYDSLYLKSAVYREMTGQFALSKASSADIVFLGNSITYGGQWGELLGRERVVNRGIGGDNTLGMLHRLQDVYRLHPKLVFIMAGINDLYADASVDLIMKNYMMILDTFRVHGVTPVIQSTLHVNPKWKRAEEKNRSVAELNGRLREAARSRGLEFLDVNAVLSADSTLKDEFTTDGVHLTSAAYGRWCDLILAVLTRRGI